MVNSNVTIEALKECVKEKEREYDTLLNIYQELFKENLKIREEFESQKNEIAWLKLTIAANELETKAMKKIIERGYK